MPNYTRPEYSILRAAIARCHHPMHPSFKNYGKRGIRVCAEWRAPRGFEAFIAHIGPRPDRAASLDRIDNEKGYVPGNVRWTNRNSQSRNMRSNVFATLNGERMCLRDWASKLGVNYNALVKRKLRGWSDADTLTMPLDRKANVIRFYHG